MSINPYTTTTSQLFPTGTNVTTKTTKKTVTETFDEHGDLTKRVTEEETVETTETKPNYAPFVTYGGSGVGSVSTSTPHNITVNVDPSNALDPKVLAEQIRKDLGRSTGGTVKGVSSCGC